MIVATTLNTLLRSSLCPCSLVYLSSLQKRCYARIYTSFPGDVERITSYPLHDEGKLVSDQQSSTWKPIIPSNVVIDDTKLPSVTTILSATMSPKSARQLRLYREKLVKLHGKDLAQVVMRKRMDVGKELHYLVERYYMGDKFEDLDIPIGCEGYWNSLLTALSLIPRMEHLEEMVYHRELLYKGVIDALGMYDGTMHLIDWKTKNKRVHNLQGAYDDPVQIAAYVGAVSGSNAMPCIKKGLLVYCYDSGDAADIIPVDESALKLYWDEWTQRVRRFWELRERKNSSEQKEESV